MNSILYFPVDKAPFAFRAGLSPLGTSFNNGSWDKKFFQIDENLPEFLANKLKCRQEKLDKYYCQSNLSPDRQRCMAEWMTHQLVSEYPADFQLTKESDQQRLLCKRTQEALIFDDSYELIDSLGSVAYVDSLDALACQVPEDIALIHKDSGSPDHLSLHLCSPSYWSAREKIGKSFTEIHEPVPNMQKISRASSSFVDAMVNKGPFVRFIWSFVTDDRLNHHPEPPPGVDPDSWIGRRFSFGKEEPFYLRVERQVTMGFPEQSFAAFFIRIHFIKGTDIRSNPAWRTLLIENIESLDEETARYKGLKDNSAQLLNWLRT